MCFILRSISETHHPSHYTKVESKGRCSDKRPDKTLACGAPAERAILRTQIGQTIVECSTVNTIDRRDLVAE